MKTQYLRYQNAPTEAQVTASSWRRRTDQPLQNQGVVRIDVFPSQQFQTWEGFGSAVSELGCDAVNALSPHERGAFFEAVFGDSGLGLDWIRLPIGASDFARDAYSFAPVADDLDMAHFDLERDTRTLIPFIRSAQQVNPGLRVHASPWSPPGWMKVSGRMDGANDSRIREDPAILEAYAHYLRRFVQAYAEHGIRIDRLFVQNEMDSPAPFPGCRWDPALFAEFHWRYLKPELERHLVPVELWGGTFRTISGSQAHACMDKPDFRGSIQGLGVQYAFTDALKSLQLLYPGTRLMHTESVCHDGRNTEVQAIAQFDDALSYINANVSVFSYWNTVLASGAASSWGWVQNSLCSVNTKERRLVYNPDYQVFLFLSQNVRPGSVRVASFSFEHETLCMRNPDGSLSLLLRNLGDAKDTEVNIDGTLHRERLPAGSLCALHLTPASH